MMYMHLQAMIFIDFVAILHENMDYMDEIDTNVWY